ncbi:O-methyltransferase [Rheinheimera sp.]|uniref:O-methyltransferase n=1 Tax=Rheinheimera sp. TaxID=1869214 RepID=UPI00307E3A46
MSSNVPYHLRTNKSIDRQIFFEILSLLKVPSKIQDYKYVSLGGPMLEDHHLLHSSLGISNLESLERDKSVFSRQQFNKNFKCISCVNTSINDYINAFERNSPTIFWLDYTDTKWGSQFRALHLLLGKLDAYDICKFTINANPDVLSGDANGSSKVDVFKKKADCRFLNENLIENDVSTMDRFAKTLTDMIQTAVESALKTSEELIFKPLCIFRYIDNRHQMLSITGIILREDTETTSLLERSHLDVKDHICKSWQDIHEINVPDLTLREKYEINRNLPGTQVDEIIDLLPFEIDKSPTKVRAALSNYIKYYRYMPNFQRVSL